MTNPRDQRNNDSYWKYLEENSKVVATWPDWLKGERPAEAIQKPVPNDAEENKLAS